VLAAAGDARAGPLLQRLSEDVLDEAAVRTAEADRPRLIQAIAPWREIVAAHQAGGLVGT
jgi:hypothetical protein